MGMVYRKQYTMPLPPGAEITERDGKRVARWRLRNGQLRTGDVVDSKDGGIRVRGCSRFYMARYRDGNGDVVDVATECKDEVAARAILTKLERRAELIRADVITADEGDAADHAGLPLSTHFDAYEQHLRAKDGNPRRIAMLRRRLERLARDCRFSKLNKMSAGPVEQWLVEQADAEMSAATRNSYREAAICFGNWCRRTHRLTYNPFADVPRADQNAHRRHERRAFREEELVQLLKVARLRPLAEYGREITTKDSAPSLPRRSRATWKREPLTIQNLDSAVERAREALTRNPNLTAQLERTGYERELIYRTLVLTGLRKGELASITVGQVELEAPVPYAVLNAADEKNRRGSDIRLRADLAAELRLWLEGRLGQLQAKARKEGRPIPVHLPASTPLFRVPSELSRIFNRDLAAAGIPKRDERNRVVDVHALRVTFGSHLCAVGVPLRTAQAAMRHSKPELTANIFTDPKLLDVAGAINALPAFSADTRTVATATRVAP
ncbi:MAG: site-specific integrase [Phycisphaerales bacterium]|nr:MAG: site-specific integrase [Phycisphaerales bacterium]